MRKIVAVLSLLVLVGCGQAPTPSVPVPSDPPTTVAPTESKTLTVVGHDSFEIAEEDLAQFETDTGIDVTIVASAEAGTLVNQLILSKDSPLGDVVFGIDNTFAGRAISEGILTPYQSKVLPAGAEGLEADDLGSLTPIDYGDVCLNADTNWFDSREITIPETLDDLVKPEYKDLLVVSNPASSSPGLVFLIETIAAKGDPGYVDYWTALKNNGVKVVKDWTQAYSVEFSGSEGKGSRPLVLSYASSPMYEAGDNGLSPTVALPKTCFRQIEYAGIIAGTQNEVGAGKFIDFLLSTKVQTTIPDKMYMSPVDTTAVLPADWAKYTGVVTEAYTLDPVQISANRETWIKTWTETVIG